MEAASIIIDHISGLLQQNPVDFSITILPTCSQELHEQNNIDDDDDDVSWTQRRISESVIVAEGTHLGLDARALPWITTCVRGEYKRLRNEGFPDLWKVTSCLLLVNPDHATVWADRRRSILRMQTSNREGCENVWIRERRYLNLLMTHHSKAPSSWAHRKYVLKKIQEYEQEKYEIDSRLFLESIGYLIEEIPTCAAVAEQFPRNYYAWTHRRYAMELIETNYNQMIMGEKKEDCISDLLSILDNEWSNMVSWMARHPSDHSAAHYGSQILQIRMKYVHEDDQSGKDGGISSSLDSCRKITEQLPSHETSWILRKFVVSIAIQYLIASGSDGDCSSHELCFEIWKQDILNVFRSVSDGAVEPTVAVYSYILWVLSKWERMRSSDVSLPSGLIGSESIQDIKENTVSQLKSISDRSWYEEAFEGGRL